MKKVMGVFVVLLLVIFYICFLQYRNVGKIELTGYIVTNENIIRFRDYLNAHGIVATIRRELGSDIDAACGQLRKKEVSK